MVDPRLALVARCRRHAVCAYFGLPICHRRAHLQQKAVKLNSRKSSPLLKDVHSEGSFSTNLLSLQRCIKLCWISRAAITGIACHERDLMSQEPHRFALVYLRPISSRQN